MTALSPRSPLSHGKLPRLDMAASELENSRSPTGRSSLSGPKKQVLDIWRSREELLAASTDMARLVEYGAVSSLDTLVRGGHSPRIRRRSVGSSSISCSLPQSPLAGLGVQPSPFAHKAEAVLAPVPMPKLSRCLALTPRSQRALLSVDDSLAGLHLRERIESQAGKDL
eukprot:jgi/Mesvir1/27488/Mv07260-RA.1